MAKITADRVMETTTSTGTGSITLAGAVTGFRAFSAVCANNDTVDYTIYGVDGNGNPNGQWESGLGTWTTGGTLARTTPQAGSSATPVSFSAGTKNVMLSPTAVTLTQNPIESLIIAVGDETTAITTGNAKVTFRMPYAFTLTAVRASLTTVSSSGTPTVDINEGGGTILSTKLTIDASEKSSVTAATPPVISDTSLADDAEITIDIDVAGTGAAGLKVYLIGRRT